MSALTDLIYAGSNAVAGLTEGAVNDAIAKHGADTPVAFSDTAYFFPTIYAATGVKVKTLGDLPACVGVLKSLITNQDDIGAALNAGLATAVGAEIIEGLKYVGGGDPYAEDSGIGFVPDPIIRSLGVPLVTGDIPGVAVVLGKADDAEDVAKVVKDYQSKGILTFMIGECIEQALEKGVKMGLELRVVPLGHDVTSVIHVVTVAIRAALIFGNVQPGDLAVRLQYKFQRAGFSQLVQHCLGILYVRHIYRNAVASLLVHRCLRTFIFHTFLHLINRIAHLLSRRILFGRLIGDTDTSGKVET